MRDEKNRLAGLEKRFQRAHALALELLVPDGEDFVEQQDVRIQVRRDRKSESHVHARGVVLDRHVHEVPQPGVGDDAVVDGEGFGAREAVDRRVEEDVLLTGQLRMKTGAQLDHAADADTAAHQHLSAGWPVNAGDDLQQRALAGAVAADERDRLPGRHADRHFAQRPEFLAARAVAGTQHPQRARLDVAGVVVQHEALGQLPRFENEGHESAGPPPGAHSERNLGKPAGRVQRRSYHVGCVVAIRAVVERARGETRRRLRAGAAGMADAGARHVARRPADVAESTAEVGVLPIEEVALVEAADTIERLASDRASPRPSPSPRRRSRRPRRRGPRRAGCAAPHRRDGKNLRQQRVPAEEAGPGVRLAARAGLDAAVGVEQLRRRDRAVRHATSSVRRSAAKAPGSTRQSGFSSHSSAASVVRAAWLTAAPKPRLVCVDDQAHTGCGAQTFNAVVAGGVVHDDDLVRHGGEIGRCRCGARDGVRSGVEVHDDDGDLRSSACTPAQARSAASVSRAVRSHENSAARAIEPHGAARRVPDRSRIAAIALVHRGTSSGSSSTPASPTSSGIDERARGDDRNAAAHRFQHRQPEAFVARRIDEQRRRRDTG